MTLTLLRARFAALPFQISHFDRLGEVPSYLALSSVLPDDRLAASMDDDGDIRVDREQLALLETRLRADVDDARLVEIRARHCERLAALRALVDRGASGALAPAEIGEVGERIAAVAPYGLATKVLPGVLRDVVVEGVRARGLRPSDEEMRALLEPARTRTTDLALDLLRACRDCREDGSRRAQVIETLCARHTGLGPHAWEMPGYESKAYVQRRLERQFAGIDDRRLAAMERRLMERRDARETAAADARRALGRDLPVEHLRAWTAYVDEQTTVMRWAFYRGVLPSLRVHARRWAAEGRLARPADVLFMTRHELARGPDAAWRDRIGPRETRYRRRRPADPDPIDRLTALLVSDDEPVPGTMTTRGPAVSAPSPATTDAASFEGLPAGAPCTVTGPACVARSVDDALDGSILVAVHVTPDMAPAFWKIAGVVVEEGGLIQHATTLAREFGLPCVVGVEHATQRIPPGALLELDGRTGRMSVVGRR